MRKPVFLLIAALLIVWLGYYGFADKSSNASTDWEDNISWVDAGITKDALVAKGKPVYLFVTTEWCTYCKKMKAETFTDIDVQERLSNSFVSIYLNPEQEGTARFTGTSMTYKELATQLGVTGYPTNVFFSETGEILGVQPGYLDTENMKQITKYVGDGHYKDKSFPEFISGVKN